MAKVDENQSWVEQEAEQSGNLEKQKEHVQVENKLHFLLICSLLVYDQYVWKRAHNTLQYAVFFVHSFLHSTFLFMIRYQENVLPCIQQRAMHAEINRCCWWDKKIQCNCVTFFFADPSVRQKQYKTTAGMYINKSATRTENRKGM